MAILEIPRTPMVEDTENAWLGNLAMLLALTLPHMRPEAAARTRRGLRQFLGSRTCGPELRAMIEEVLP